MFKRVPFWALGAILAACVLVSPMPAGSAAASRGTLMQAQQALKTRGYYYGEIDGEHSPKFRVALQRYQRDQRIAATGGLDDATLTRLGVTPVQEKSGEASRARISPTLIMRTQQKLQEWNYYRGEIDGELGRATRAALSRYQEEHDLEPTGRLTRQTAEGMGLLDDMENPDAERFEVGEIARSRTIAR